MTRKLPSMQRIEMKFRCDAALSAQVKQWARDHLGVNENCSSSCGDACNINTLYLDTRELDLLHRTGVIGPAKHRIRRYGNEQTLWLETKRKKKMVVRKNRTAVFESDLMPRVMSLNRGGPVEESATDDSWCGDWFLDRLDKRRLQPAIQIAYQRFARTTTHNGENLRLTIDSQMTASPVKGWSVATPPSDEIQDRRSFADGEVLKLKFHNQMPHLFKELLRTFVIPATGFSKYRVAMQWMQTTRLSGGSEKMDQPGGSWVDAHELKNA